MRKKHHVKLSAEEREVINEVGACGSTSKTVRKRCNILLLADESVGKPAPQVEIAVRCGVTDVTVYQAVKDYATQGIEYALRRRVHAEPPRKRIIGGETEARIIALACGEAPKGFSRWTVRLLTAKVIELSILPEARRETIRRTLKKRHLSLI